MWLSQSDCREHCSTAATAAALENHPDPGLVPDQDWSSQQWSQIVFGENSSLPQRAHSSHLYLSGELLNIISREVTAAEVQTEADSNPAGNNRPDRKIVSLHLCWVLFRFLLCQTFDSDHVSSGSSTSPPLCDEDRSLAKKFIQKSNFIFAFKYDIYMKYDILNICILYI